MKRSNRLQEYYQLAITDRDNKIQAIQYENVGLQGEIRAKDHQIARCENSDSRPDCKQACSKTWRY